VYVRCWLDVEVWNLQHEGDTKVDTQRDDGQKTAVLLLHERLEHSALAHLTKLVPCIPQIETFPFFTL